MTIPGLVSIIKVTVDLQGPILPKIIFFYTRFKTFTLSEFPPKKLFHKLKAGFHMIADDRGSRIADRRSQKVLRSSAIIWKRTSAIVCDQLRSCDHMETKVLGSAIETYPIIF